MEFDYDPALDRIDVSVRAICHDAKKGGRLLREAGINPELVDQNRLRPATEKQVFALLRACPDLLAAALLMLHRYYQACGDGRPAFYERLAAL